MTTDRNWKQQQSAAQARQAILDAVAFHLDAYGRSPTQAEVGKIIGLAEVTVRRHVARLREERKLAPGARLRLP